MIIGIDIDGVLIDDDTYRLDNMAKYCYENELPNIYEDYRKKYFFNYIKTAPVRAYASEIIKKLHDEGHKIIIITGRYKTQEDSELGNQMRQDTVNWLNSNNIIYDKICYAHFPKNKEVIENNIDIMIDDAPGVISEIAKFATAFCFDNRYNRDLNVKNMVRVFSWYDIYRKIKELS